MFRLAQNYPNPFNASTTISFAVEPAAEVNLQVVDIQGRIVATLIHGEILRGAQKVTFEPNGLASGVYFCRLLTADRTRVVKMMYLK